MNNQREIVLVPFPFTNQNQSKLRPTLVISNDKYNKGSSDLVAVPLTSNLAETGHSILITNENLEFGGLFANSRIKVDKIFSIEKRLIKSQVGTIDKKTFSKVVGILLQIID